MSLTRRSFIGWLGAAPLIGLFPNPGLSSDKRILMNQFSIAGFQYYDGRSILHRIKAGDALTLWAEPGNPYDEFAVAIYRGKTKLGYVPRSDNRHISRLLTHKVKLFCHVKHVRPQDPGRQAVKADVYLITTE